MVLKMYVYLKEKNVLASLGVEGQSDSFERQVVDLHIKDSAIVGYYVLPDKSYINLITEIDDLLIVYDENTIALLDSKLSSNEYSIYTRDVI